MTKSELQERVESLHKQVDNLVAANRRATDRAAMLTVEKKALEDKIEWLKARLAELEAGRAAT